MTTFLVVDIPFAYNTIMGRLTLNVLRAIPSTYHRMVKFSTTRGIGTVYEIHQSTKCCAIATLKDSRVRPTLQIEPDAIAEVDRPTPAGDLKEVLLTPGRYVRIGVDLHQPSKDDLTVLFAWKPTDMLGIDYAAICHRLAVDRWQN